MTLETIISIFSIVANLTIVIAMSIKTYKQEKKRAMVNSDWQIKEATLVFANEILEKTDTLFLQIKNKYKDDTINISDLQREENSELSQVIFKYLRLMERFSVGLNTNIYDLDIYARICCRKTIEAWEQLKRVVEYARKTTGSDQTYIEFEYVVDKLKQWRTMGKGRETRGEHTGLK